jgi:hypothetical protein
MALAKTRLWPQKSDSMNILGAKCASTFLSMDWFKGKFTGKPHI